MEIAYCDILRDIHTALDEITPADDNADDFTTDMDTELRQAVNSAVEQLLVETGEHLLTLSNGNGSSVVTEASGSCTVTLPDDFLRFFELRFSGWRNGLRTLTEPGTRESDMQQSAWTCGSKEKPVAIPTVGTDGKRLLRVWGADGELTLLAYLKKPTYTTDKLTAPIRDEMYKLIVYRAAGIYLDTHREGDGADRYYELSKTS